MGNFLTCYAVAAAAALVASLLLRRRALAGRDTGAATSALGPYELAYLNGGAGQAVAAASAALHLKGVLSAPGDRQLAVTGELPPTAHRLERAALRAVESGTATSGRALRNSHHVRTVLKDVAEDLFRDGLLVGTRTRRDARWASWPVFAVLALGLLRLTTGSDPVSGLVPVIGVAVVQVALLAWRVPAVTRRGTRTLATGQRQNQHLAPALNPSWDTYGPVGAAMGVALFGITALRSADPAFAAELDLPPYRGSSGGSGIDMFTHRDPSCGTTGYGGGCGDGSGGGGGCGGGGGGGGCGGGGT